MFLEFGVFKCVSVDVIRHTEQQIKPYFFGFDAFKGAEEKEDKYSPWHTSFNLDGVINPELLDKEVEIIPGWFSDTLNDETVKKFGKKKADLFTLTVIFTVLLLRS